MADDADTLELLTDLRVHGREPGPAAGKGAADKQMTVSALAAIYVAEGCGHKKPSTLLADRGRFTHHILPTIGSMRIDAVTRPTLSGCVTLCPPGRRRLSPRRRAVGDLEAWREAGPAQLHKPLHF